MRRHRCLLFVFILFAACATTPSRGPASTPEPEPNRIPPPRTPTAGASPGGQVAQTFGRPPYRFANFDSAKFAVVKIYYGTNRKPTGSSFADQFFGSGRSSIQTGVAFVSIPRIHKCAKIETPSLVRGEFRPDASKHMILKEVRPLERGQFFKSLSSTVRAYEEKKLFVFIHGYNNSFEEAALRAAQLFYDLAFEGAPVLYSWPSAGELGKYVQDQNAADFSAPQLRRFLDLLAEKSGADVIHVIAHSMGNRVLAGALRSPVRWENTTLQRVVLAAPDIDDDTMRNLASVLQRCNAKATLYASSRDLTLIGSEFINVSLRAGRSKPAPLILPGVETIDVSDLESESFLDDILRHSIFASSRFAINDLYTLFQPEDEMATRPCLIDDGGFKKFDLSRAGCRMRTVCSY